MKNTIISLAVVTLLAGCATGSALREKITGNQFDEPVVEQSVFLKKDTNKLQPPSSGPITVAVYSFQDKTGQRKSMPNIASLSSAVTQGAESYLIKALQDVGDQRWFTVLERVGLDNLIKERQMIRQMREQYQGKDAKPLPPMMFAGIIMEGGIIGYDSNTTTGGSGVRLFGIGASTQYQSDTVTVNLRAVSVSNGEVLTSVTVTKTVLSYMDKFGVLKFVDSGTTSVEAETGGSINESINKATAMAIQAAVIDTIKEGARKGHWAFKDNTPTVVPLPIIPALMNFTAPKPEEKKDELVQTQTPKESATAKEPPATASQQSNDGKVPAGVEGKIEAPKEKVEAKKEEPKKPIVLFGLKKLKENAFVYKTADDKSQKTWALNKDTEMTIITPGPEGWHYVTDAKGHKGFVKQEVLIDASLKEEGKK